MTAIDKEIVMPGARKLRTTMAAEGLPRFALTVEDVYKMVEAGILSEDDRVELIEGELVPMSPKGNHHEVLKARLTVHFARTMPADVPSKRNHLS